MTAVQLMPIHESSLPLQCDLGSIKDVGRLPALGVANRHVSRLHCKVGWDGSDFVLVYPLKVTKVTRSDGSHESLPAHSVAKLFRGDTLYLLPGHEPIGYHFPLDCLIHDVQRTDSDALLQQLTSGAVKKRPRSSSPGRSDDTLPAPQGGPSQCTVFTGCIGVFWLRQHESVIERRFRKCGGAIEPSVTAATTHVVCAANESVELALAKLAADLEGAADAVANAEAVARRVRFVTRDWVSASLAKGERQPEADYSARVQFHLLGATATNPTHPAMAQRSAEGAVEGALARSAPSPFEMLSDKYVRNAAAPDLSALEAAFPGGAVTETWRGCEVLVAWRPDGWHPEAWGRGDVWLEPFDLQSAADTMQKVYKHWHRLDNLDDSCMPWARAMGVQTASEAPGGGGGRAATSGCSHPCCQASRVCLIAELKELKTHYVNARTTDQFRARAADRAIATLMGLTHALRTAEDVEDLGPAMGPQSKKKVAEMIETGRLGRNEYQRNDPRQAVLELFIKVWGVGPVTANSWYDSGFRTLEDARGCSILTSQQKAGLRHFDDFQERIPREEAEAFAAIVRERVLQQLAFITGLSREELEPFLHCRPVGSFIRGKPMTGDIDMMVVPNDAAGQVCCLQLLSGVIGSLRASHFVTDDMQIPTHDAKCRCKREQATWFGVCHVPGFPGVARRFDIKFYPREHRVCAINYFTGSEVFLRALRYWCDSPPPEVARGAQKWRANGDCFRLSDSGLAVRVKAGLEDDNSVEVPVRCESDIFKALQLHYVPPHLRHYMDWK